MNKQVKDINFSMMPHPEGLVSYGKSILMYDCLDVDVKHTITAEIDAFISDLPKKIDFIIILVCVKGKINIRCNFEDYCVNENDVFLMVPGTICEKLDIDPESRLIVISLPDSSLAPGLSFENALYSSENFSKANLVSLSPAMVSSGVTIYRQMKQTLQNKENPVNEDLIRAYIMVFAGLAASSMQKWIEENKEKENKNTDSRDAMLKNFLSRVEKEHREHRDVAYYAQQEGITPKYFAKIIFTKSGKHPLEWIKYHVVLDAQLLLKSKEHTIDQICQILNFANRSQFNRYFKERTGMSPGEYIKSSI